MENSLLNAVVQWENENRVPEEERGKTYKTAWGIFYEDPPYGRNDDGSPVLPPEFGNNI